MDCKDYKVFDILGETVANLGPFVKSMFLTLLSSNYASSYKLKPHPRECVCILNDIDSLFKVDRKGNA